MEVKVIVFKSVPNNDKAEGVTTSMNVAEVFGKQHKHVLRDIKELDCSEEFRKSNFGLLQNVRQLPNGGSKTEPYFTMTRDGFTFLVMGYRGKKAAQFKEAYIKAFNRMEKELASWRKTRGLAIAVRKSLTDAIRDNLDTTKPFVYSNYTKLAVKKAFGKSIDEIREERGISKDKNLRDFLNSEETERLNKMESEIAGMVRAFKIIGMDDKEIYAQIRKADIRWDNSK